MKWSDKFPHLKLKLEHLICEQCGARRSDRGWQRLIDSALKEGWLMVAKDYGPEYYSSPEFYCPNCAPEFK